MRIAPPISSMNANTPRVQTLNLGVGALTGGGITGGVGIDIVSTPSKRANRNKYLVVVIVTGKIKPR
jgi:hypothetical protein